MQRTLNIPIPERDDAPKTTLYVKIISADNEINFKSKPTIFMLPGGPGANHSHYKDYSCLKDVANIIFHDPRGCGLSEKGDRSTYTMNNYIQDVDIIRQHLGLDKIILLGKSYGAMCALGYTLRYPDAVSTLLLAAGSPHFKNVETAKAHVLSRGTEEQKQVCEKLWNGIFESNNDLVHFFEVMNPLYSYKRRHGEATNRPIPDYPYAHEPLNQGFSTFLRQFDYEDRLHEIKCKTLILVGEEDWITDKKHSQIMANKIPNNELIIFPKSDHSMESDVPDLFFGAMRQFISLGSTKKLMNEIQIAQQYDSFATTYSQLVVDRNKDSNSVYFSFFDTSLTGKCVLDLGCGTGYDLTQMKLRGAVIFGIDSSKEMVQIAQQNNPEAVIKFGDFAKIPFEDHFFDLVISKWAFQTASHIDPIYTEVSRVLKMDGQLIYLTAHPIRQFIEKKRSEKDYFKKEIVESVFFNGKITAKEPSHTMNEYLSPAFFKHFSLLAYHEGNDADAERINGDIYPSYFMVRANRRSG